MLLCSLFDIPFKSYSLYIPGLWQCADSFSMCGHYLHATSAVDTGDTEYVDMHGQLLATLVACFCFALFFVLYVGGCIGVGACVSFCLCFCIRMFQKFKIKKKRNDKEIDLARNSLLCVDK